MSKFVIQPHFRLQEWVADEKGYFSAEDLDYVFNEEVQATDGKVHDKGQKVGACASTFARCSARNSISICGPKPTRNTIKTSSRCAITR